MLTIEELEAREAGLTSEIERLLDEDISSAINDLPIGHSSLINRLAQDRNILHAAMARLREHEQR